MRVDLDYTRTTENAITQADTATRQQAAEILQAIIGTDSFTMSRQTRKLLRHTTRRMSRRD